MPSIEPQPLIAVADVEVASAWYQKVLGATSGHGGKEYEQLVVDRHLVLQLHVAEEPHHHGTISDPTFPTGNGMALWFSSTHFDDVVDRIREVEAKIVADVTPNPNSGLREIWIRDLDGYLVIFAERP
ncbi:MAG: VOC family protein [Solirubrobacteraceae bacterium]|nr:VOC family protein [Solirubrobacteraceae bacterium]